MRRLLLLKLVFMVTASCAPALEKSIIESKPKPLQWSPFNPPWWLYIRYAAAGSKVEVRAGQGDSVSLRPPAATLSAAARARHAAPLHPDPDPPAGRVSRHGLTDVESIHIVSGRDKQDRS